VCSNLGNAGFMPSTPGALSTPSRTKSISAMEAPSTPYYSGSDVTVLQHTCFVYAAEIHPVAAVRVGAHVFPAGGGGMQVGGKGQIKGGLLLHGSCGMLVATGAYDGCIRLFDGMTGRVLCCVKVREI
jgi:hypothetical protein